MRRVNPSRQIVFLLDGIDKLFHTFRPDERDATTAPSGAGQSRTVTKGAEMRSGGAAARRDENVQIRATAPVQISTTGMTLVHERAEMR